MPETTGTYKPLVLVDTENLPEDEWLEWRRRGIGGSDAAAILGVSPFATARDLYYDKLKVISYEDGESNWVSKKVGHLLEDLVAEIFHVKTGFRIYQVKKMFYHPVYTYMLADIDYFIELPNGKTAILEIKTTNYTASSALGSSFDWSLRAFEVAVDTGYDFTQIPDFGETLQNNIFEWFSIEENRILWEELKDMVSIEKKETNISEVQDNPFVGKALVVTGKVEPYTRDGINAKIASLGAKAGSSVSKNTDYLICGENAGSKLTKAQSLGVTVLSPAEFFSMIGE